MHVFRNTLIKILVVFCSVYVTSLLHQYFNNAVLASSFVGVMAGMLHFLLKEKLQGIALGGLMFCASFIGMGTIEFSLVGIVAVSVICVLLFKFMEDKAMGFGGKQGFIAFVSSVLFLISNQHFIVYGEGYSIFSMQLPVVEMVIMSLICMSGFMITYFLQHHKHWNVVLSSALPTFIISLFIYISSSLEISSLYLSIFYGSTFIGMMSQNIFQTKLTMIGIPIVFIAVFFISTFLIDGIGGLLGTQAFFTIIFLVILERIFVLPVCRPAVRYLLKR